MKTAEYKDSGAEWIGRLPKRWDIKPAFSVFEELDERNENGAVKNVLSLSYGRIVRRDVESNFGLLPQSFNTYQIVQAGDIVLRLLDLQNDHVSLRVGLVPEDGIVTSAYLSVRPKGGLDSRFAAYLLHAYDLKKVFYSFGGGCRQSMGFEDLRRLPIPFPSPDEQKKIVAYLDEATAKVDRLIKLRERQMELLREQRAALIQQGVTRGLNPNVPLTDSGLPWLGQIPKQWKTTQVRRISSFVTSGSRGWAEFYSDSGDIFVQSGNLTRDMKVDLDNAQKVQPPVGAEGKRTLIAQDDVLICVTGGLTGNVAYVDFPPPTAYINQHVALVRSRQSLVAPKFLATALWSAQGQTQFKIAEYGGTKQGLSLDDVRLAWVALPPRAEQIEILDFIQKESAKIDRILSTYTRQIELLTEYRAALIHECVTGQRAVSTT